MFLPAGRCLMCWPSKNKKQNSILEVCYETLTMPCNDKKLPFFGGWPVSKQS